MLFQGISLLLIGRVTGKAAVPRTTLLLSGPTAVYRWPNGLTLNNFDLNHSRISAPIAAAATGQAHTWRQITRLISWQILAFPLKPLRTIEVDRDPK